MQDKFIKIGHNEITKKVLSSDLNIYLLIGPKKLYNLDNGILFLKSLLLNPVGKFPSKFYLISERNKIKFAMKLLEHLQLIYFLSLTNYQFYDCLPVTRLDSAILDIYDSQIDIYLILLKLLQCLCMLYVYIKYMYITYIYAMCIAPILINCRLRGDSTS